MTIATLQFALAAAVTTAAFTGLSLSPAAASTDARQIVCSTGAEMDPFKLYGNEIRFQVLRNGSPVGKHHVAFKRQGDDVIVDTRFEVAVKVLTVALYRYEYEATDVWRDGCLVNMRVNINDDGKRYSVSADEDGAKLVISGPSGSTSAPLGLFPTHHWNAGVLDATQVLNTITGRVTDVRIVDRGMETVPVNGSVRPARHYVYTGELHTEVWYDAQGRWVKMRFVGQDGSNIEYVCQSCSLDRTVSK